MRRLLLHRWLCIPQPHNSIRRETQPSLVFEYSSRRSGNFPDRAGFARPLDTQSGMRRPTPALDLKQHGDAIAGYLPEQTVALLVVK